MNLNKGCIEICCRCSEGHEVIVMNLNKGCIEIVRLPVSRCVLWLMNLNKGCIEIFDRHVFLQILQGWTLTRVVLKSVADVGDHVGFVEMNLNKGCIEIIGWRHRSDLIDKMNLNKGCIEMACIR